MQIIINSKFNDDITFKIIKDNVIIHNKKKILRPLPKCKYNEKYISCLDLINKRLLNNNNIKENENKLISVSTWLNI